jgi:dTDP-4-amino-4,6-dideoxygalactose transaminase
VNERPEHIPMLDLAPGIEEQFDDLMKAMEGVLRSGTFILGPNVEAFEGAIAEYLGVKHAIGVNSGTDALVISLRALGIEPGDEVITTPFTFFATAESIWNVGATPVFVDIDPATFCIDPDLIEPAITERTKAILPVHLFGHPVDMGRITAIARSHGLDVIEDCAQALGARYQGRKVGSFGQANAFSFFPSKNLGAFGDAGLVASDDDGLADQARMLRAHGAKRKYEHEMLGFNSRLDELQAAILGVRLARLDDSNEGRRRVAARYNELLAGIPDLVTPTETEGVHHVYHQYTVRVTGGHRDAVQEALADEGIGSKVYYPIPCHHLPIRGNGDRDLSLPAADTAAAEVLSLPIGELMQEAQLRRVAVVIASVTGDPS